MPGVDIIIKDTPFDPFVDTGIVSYYQDNNSKYIYKVWLYLDGEKLFYVDYVSYTLHPSFTNPVRKIYRDMGNPNCALQIWTPGAFSVQAVVYLKTGEVINAEHYLTYESQIKGNNLKYIDIGSYSGVT